LESVLGATPREFESLILRQEAIYDDPDENTVIVMWDGLGHCRHTVTRTAGINVS
jgi:hypothetical protein